jgi:ABC-2 type transport system permease protein
VRKIWAVVRREFLERVRNKWFIISTVLGPVFMIAVIVLPPLLSTRGGRPADIALVDEGAGTLAERLTTQLRRGGRFTVTVVRPEAAARQAVLDSLTAAVQRQQLDGYLAVGAATLEAGSVEYRGRNVASIRDMAVLETAVRQAVLVERLQRRGVDPALVQEAQSRIAVRTLRITKRGATGETGEATFLLAYIIGFVLYTAIVLYGVGVMRSVIEEKQTRIIEVLVSSMKPFQLLSGKVVGVAGVGLLQLSIWALAATAMIRFRAQLFGLLGVPAAEVAQVQLPSVGAAVVAATIGYFLLGYLLYSALFAVVGASVNTDSEAQQAQTPVIMLLVVSLLMFLPVLNEPGGRLALVTSVIPFSAPIIMPVRVAASEVPLGQVALSLVSMAVATLLVVWVSARIYRVGILMYGKRPGLRELLRWVRQS